MSRLLYILLVICSGLKAQDLPAILKSVSENYAQSKSVEMILHISYLNQADSLLSEESGKVIMNKQNNYYSQMNEQEIIVVDTVSLMISDLSKEILISVNNNQVSRAELMQFFDDSIAHRLPKAKLISSKNHIQTLEVYSQQMQLKMLYTVDVKNSILHQLEYVYDNAQDGLKRVVIDYNPIKINESISKGLFKLNTYVVGEMGNYCPSEKYSEYKIIEL